MLIHRTVRSLRRWGWLDVALTATPIILVLSAACGQNGYTAAPLGNTSGVAAAERMPLGMDMSSPASSQAAPSGPSDVAIRDFKFGPADLAVSTGTTVTWTNDDRVTHTVTARDGSFDSSNLEPGQQFSFTFSTPGTYAYQCSIHPFMTGQVIVQ